MCHIVTSIIFILVFLRFLPGTSNGFCHIVCISSWESCFRERELNSMFFHVKCSRHDITVFQFD